MFNASIIFWAIHYEVVAVNFTQLFTGMIYLVYEIWCVCKT